MMSLHKKDHFHNLAQTSSSPLAFEVYSAEGIYLFDHSKKPYIDLIAGISVSSTGHRHPKVVAAIQKQLERHLHVMVFGEFMQEPQIKLASKLAEILPRQLNTTYFVNSGSEAVEGALKLAKRFTGRHEIIAFKNAYHGSTHGALSVTGNESLKIRYRPLLPSIKHLSYNKLSDLEQIKRKTACVIIEPVQGEAGVVPADKEFLAALREKCSQTGSLLIFDEIQTGMGRTGSMFAFEKYSVIPDILLLAKAFGGGLPLGAFIATEEIMQCLSHDPALGHITTFGGHPLSCAAALANIEVILEEGLVKEVEEKAKKVFTGLKDLPLIKAIRHSGLLMALQFENEQINHDVIQRCLQKGLITDWFLFKPDALRIAPPLTITETEINSVISIIEEAVLEAGTK
jgi:acetylornithine/succinyldiaminopimelate/putrescine aminotransferase